MCPWRYVATTSVDGPSVRVFVTLRCYDVIRRTKCPCVRGVRRVDVEVGVDDEPAVALSVGHEDGHTDETGADHAPVHPRRADPGRHEDAEEDEGGEAAHGVQDAVGERLGRGVAAVAGELVEDGQRGVHEDRAADEGDVQRDGVRHDEAFHDEGEPEEHDGAADVQAQQERLHVSRAPVGDRRDDEAEQARAEDGDDDERAGDSLVVGHARRLQVDVEHAHEAERDAVGDGEDEAERQEAAIAHERRQRLPEVGAHDGGRQAGRVRRARGEVDDDEKEGEGRQGEVDVEYERDAVPDVVEIFRRRVVAGRRVRVYWYQKWAEQEGRGAA